MSYGDFAPEDIGGYCGFVIIQSGYGVYYNSGSFRATFHPDKTYYVTRTILPSGGEDRHIASLESRKILRGPLRF